VVHLVLQAFLENLGPREVKVQRDSKASQEGKETKETEDQKDYLEYKEPLEHMESPECLDYKVLKATKVNPDCQAFLEVLELWDERETKVQLVHMEHLVQRVLQVWKVRLGLKDLKETQDYPEQEVHLVTQGCLEFLDLKESLVCQE